MPNPFEIRSAELMDLKQVANEFVQEHTEYAKLASYSHTIVWGSRGSGKSMHFRFLEPLSQAWRRDTSFAGDVREFFKEPNSFIGVYINCRDGTLNREELRLLSEMPSVKQEFLSILFARYLSAVIIKSISTTLIEQMGWICEFPVKDDTIPAWIKSLHDRSMGTLRQVLEFAVRQASKCLFTLSGFVDRCLIDQVCSVNDFPHDIPNLTPGVLEFCKFVQDTINIDSPFFLLLDEANELAELHQRCVNSLIAVRSQKHLCIKIASQRHGFVTKRLLGSMVDETHDYTTLDLDGLYTNNREAYYKRIERIADERLKRAGIGVRICEYLPENENEVDALEKARSIAAERYCAIEESKRPADKTNFIKKYAPAIVFQEILSPKGYKTYAGFDSVVHLSSGIVRAFLDCCSKMYTRFIEKYPGEEPLKIPVSIQGDVIREYSDEFIQAQIIDKLNSLASDSKEYQMRNQLLSLLRGLGALFRARLMDKKSREPRIISVSLKNDPGGSLQEILDLAEREAFLHVKWYRSKRGNRNLRCYVLNRRLCPHFNLDHAGFQGRLELTSDQLEISLQEPEKFMKLIMGDKLGNTEESGNSQLTLFDW